MNTMPAHEYGKYTVVANPIRSAQGRYFDAFSVHDGNGGTPIGQLPVVHQQGLDGANDFATKDEAVASATRKAHAWIDAQPD